MPNITSANSIYKITIPDLAIVQHQLQGFAADAAFSGDELEVTQNVIGVDGIKSSGWVFQLYNQSVTLQADSTSSIIFQLLYQAMKTSKSAIFLDAIIELPSINQTYVLTQGTLQNYKPIPDAQQVLQAQQFMINWGSVTGAPI